MLPTLASLAMDLKASTALRVPGGFQGNGDVVVFGGKLWQTATCPELILELMVKKYP